jgi:hypothetical protein
MFSIVLLIAPILIFLKVFFLAKKTEQAKVLKNTAYVLGVGLAILIFLMIIILIRRLTLYEIFLLPGYGLILIRFFIIPIAAMLHFALFSAVSSDISSLKTRLVFLIAIPIALVLLYYYGGFTALVAFVSDEMPRWLGSFIYNFNWDIFVRILIISWLVSIIALPLVLFVKTLKSPTSYAKRKWLKIALFLPLIGPMLYFRIGRERIADCDVE